MTTGFSSAQSTARPVTVAVVRDGPVRGTDPVPGIETKLDALIAGDVAVRFKAAPEFEGAWAGAGVRAALENALRDSEADIVLGAGPIATVWVTRGSGSGMLSLFPWLLL